MYLTSLIARKIWWPKCDNKLAFVIYLFYIYNQHAYWVKYNIIKFVLSTKKVILFRKVRSSWKGNELTWFNISRHRHSVATAALAMVVVASLTTSRRTTAILLFILRRSCLPVGHTQLISFFNFQILIAFPPLYSSVVGLLPNMWVLYNHRISPTVVF